MIPEDSIYRNATEKIAKSISLIFGGTLPPNLREALVGMMNFFALRDAADDPTENPTGHGTSGKRDYDFAQDAGLIYAAFRQQYGINLLSEKLHWWEFRALLAGLDETTQFVKVVTYRGIDLSTVKDKEQKAFYKRMKERYRLRDNRTDAEREADMVAELEAAF